MKMNEFNKIIRDWLLPLGYTECYKVNHPTSNTNEVHFTKDGVRVVCVKDFGEEYCYLHSDVLLQPYALAIRTVKYELKTDKLDNLHRYVYLKSELLKPRGNLERVTELLDLWDLSVCDDKETKSELAQVLAGVIAIPDGNRETLEESYPDEKFLCMDNYDRAIIGVDELTRKVVYLESKCIQQLMEDDSCDEETARDVFEYNTIRSNNYMGDDAVIIVRDLI